MKLKLGLFCVKRKASNKVSSITQFYTKSALMQLRRRWAVA